MSAARGGETQADLWLGALCVERPRGDDYREAERLLRAAAARGFVGAWVYLGEIERKRGNALKATALKLKAAALGVVATFRDQHSPFLVGIRAGSFPPLSKRTVEAALGPDPSRPSPPKP